MQNGISLAQSINLWNVKSFMSLSINFSHSVNKEYQTSTKLKTISDTSIQQQSISSVNLWIQQQTNKSCLSYLFFLLPSATDINPVDKQQSLKLKKKKKQKTKIMLMKLWFIMCQKLFFMLFRSFSVLGFQALW